MLMVDPAVCATAGTPLSEENAKLATTNPITRCMITPFIVPALVARWVEKSALTFKRKGAVSQRPLRF
jgi:hypothetical protein